MTAHHPEGRIVRVLAFDSRVRGGAGVGAHAGSPHQSRATDHREAGLCRGGPRSGARRPHPYRAGRVRCGLPAFAEIDYPAESIASGDCRKHQQKHGLKAPAGNTLYTYWTEINWCHNPKKGWYNTDVTADGTGGETKTPGYTYRGTVDSDAGVVGTSRGWAQHWFEVAFLPDSRPCLRVYVTNHFEPGKDFVCSLG
ncbi:hypothetical protein GCM10010123_37290 [Pilimelia anulata]|uniref:Uncharacterized protein n=1 Tax=Pilimelia anulata TaxID=53371 RepID=A0A8J3B8W1_9ACTN|nr:hypothetical protein GCM10010123_37290 [Pilimelia anulata]